MVKSPSREWLETTYLPFITGSALYVGVASYTSGYSDIVPDSCVLESLDRDPGKAKYGAKLHHVADFRGFYPGYAYNHIALWGLWGQKELRNGVKDAQAFFNHAYVLLEDEGTILLHGATKTMSVTDWKDVLDDPLFQDFETKHMEFMKGHFIWWGKLSAAK